MKNSRLKPMVLWSISFFITIVLNGCGQISDQLGFTNQVLLEDSLRSTILPPLFEWKNETSTDYVLGKDGIKIKIGDGSLHEEQNNATNLLLRPIPKHADAFFVWVDAAPTQEGGEAGLILYNDDDNYTLVSMIRGERKLKYVMSTEYEGKRQFGMVSSVLDSGSGLILKIGEDGQIAGLKKSVNGKIGLVGQSGLSIDGYTKIGLIAQGGNPNVEEWATFTDFKITKNTVYRRD